MNAALHLEQLKQKRAPKMKPEIKIRILKPAKDIAVDPIEELGQDPVKAVAVIDDDDLTDPYEKKPVKRVPIIKDLRGTAKIDRDIILNRIHAHLPDKPVVSSHPFATTIKIGQDLNLDAPNLDALNLDALNLDEDSLFKVPENPKPLQRHQDPTQEPVIAIPTGAPIIIKKKKAVVKAADKALDIDLDLDTGIPAKVVKRKKIVRTDVPPSAIDFMAVKIGQHFIGDRLPQAKTAKDKIIIQASQYYMNNRKIYIKQLADLFRPYRAELAENAENISCKSSSKSKNFDLLTHQKIVRDYLNIYTPYRGLILYHGLGSGKTCSSIALAEGMKSHKRVFVMTPASLKMNFFSEIKKCGDVLYKKNQFWEFVSTEGKPDYIDVLAKSLQLPLEYVRLNKGAWLVDISKPANFADLETEQQIAVDEQLNQMIRTKYTDINYNGLNRKKMELLTGDFTRNPFDNSVVIIDEAHNFVSRIVNKLPKSSTPAAIEAAKKSISYMLYEYLMDAKNARVVLLTGTPIINYPNEIGILFNILRGYIKTWTFPVRVKTTNAVNRDTILDMFDNENFRTFDYVEYSGNKLTVTRNPFGFINTKKRGPAGHARDRERGGGRTTKRNKMANKSINLDKHNKTKKKQKNHEIDQSVDKSIYKIDQGVIKVDHDTTVTNESDPIWEQYNKDQYTGENEPHQGGGEGTEVFDRYNGVRLDDTGNITDTEFVATIKRILGKNDIEVIDSGIQIVNNKALPDDSVTFMETFIEPGAKEMKNESAFKRRILGLTSYFRSAQEKLLPQYILNEQGGIFHTVRTEMSDYQFGVYEQIRKEEEDKAKAINKKKRQQAKKGDDIFQTASTYRIFSRACCNFAFPDPPGRPKPDKHVAGLADAATDQENDQQDQQEEVDENEFDAVPLNLRTLGDDYATEEDTEKFAEADQGKQIDYQQRIGRALKHLEYNPDSPREQEFLTPEALETYSPKFLSILENLSDEDNRGLHLIYSQFRTIEGVGILKLILEANGYAEFKIQKGATDDSWTIVELPGKEDLPKFVLYTGTESAEEKEIIRNIYNGDWEYVPASITAKLREKSENNMYGEIIKILMITASGAEGINLKNTRFVHIVEPYWHMVRIEQVIGRARRICSHEELPEELRNIKVFLYLSILPKDLKTDRAKFTKHIELLNRDISRLDAKVSLTTDETLFESATIKDTINQQILMAMKETAMDCSLYSKGNREGNQSEDLVCYGFGKVTSNQFASYPTFEQDQGERDEVNVKKQVLKLSNVTLKGVKYAWNEATNELFDYESFQRAKKTGEDLLYVGRLVRDGPRKFHIDTETERV